MNSTLKLLAAAFTAAALAVPAAANAADPPPPPPKTVTGKTAKVFATGVSVPTQITFGAGKTFVAGGQEGPYKGGVFVVKKGSNRAVAIKNSPKSAYGVLWHGGKLYATQGTKVVAYSGWNGKGFKKRKTLVERPKGFPGFSGLAIGPNGRLYTGVALTQEFDHSANPMKYANTVVSLKTTGGGLKVVSTGLRQPWQLTFAKGEKSPIVSVLAQDLPEDANAPDLLVKATPGSKFGFPECNWAIGSDCAGFTEPLHLFPRPAEGGGVSPMGLASKGNLLYLALFGGQGQGPEVVTLDKSGENVQSFMTGYVAPVLSVARHGGYVYTGDLTGTIYRVKE